MNSNFLIRTIFICIVVLVAGCKSSLPISMHNNPIDDLSGPVVGAIRWDAWVGPLNAAGLEIEHTLSPQKYHYRAPFFSKKINNDSIQCRGATREIMNKEISYAKYAGIDYWAFCWYPPQSGLDTARQLYLNSAYKNEIKWCVILGTNPFDFEIDGKWLVNRFKEANYQKVTGDRPLVYIFPSDQMMPDQLTRLKTMSKEAGLPHPYFVTMAFTAKDADSICKKLGADAISCYASVQDFKTGQQYDGRLYYPMVGQSDECGWEQYKKTKNSIIPWITSGWSPKPRIERSVSWNAYYKSNGWAKDGTPDQIAQNIRNGIKWVKSNKTSVEANTILIYAWNEFDEGGWICPTFGNNTSRIDAIRGVLRTKSQEVN